jgi:RHS repeat-associated protein
VIDTIAYDGFGNKTSESNSGNGDRYGFTGRESDSATGFQYNRARWYNPMTGEWTSQDPTGFAAGDPNLYRYGANQPTRQLDPSGLAGVDAWMKWAWKVNRFATKSISGIDPDALLSGVRARDEQTAATLHLLSEGRTGQAVEGELAFSVALNRQLNRPFGPDIPGMVWGDGQRLLLRDNADAAARGERYAYPLGIALTAVTVAGLPGGIGKLTGFSESETGMIRAADKALRQAGYNTTPLKELIRADMPPGYRGMSIEGGAALGGDAFSSQDMLNHVLEEELLHLQDKAAAAKGQQFGPGTARGYEEAADARRKFPLPQR